VTVAYRRLLDVGIILSFRLPAVIAWWDVSVNALDDNVGAVNARTRQPALHTTVYAFRATWTAAVADICVGAGGRFLPAGGNAWHCDEAGGQPGACIPTDETLPQPPPTRLTGQLARLRCTHNPPASPIPAAVASYYTGVTGDASTTNKVRGRCTTTRNTYGNFRLGLAERALISACLPRFDSSRTPVPPTTVQLGYGGLNVCAAPPRTASRACYAFGLGRQTGLLFPKRLVLPTLHHDLLTFLLPWRYGCNNNVRFGSVLLARSRMTPVQLVCAARHGLLFTLLATRPKFTSNETPWWFCPANASDALRLRTGQAGW